MGVVLRGPEVEVEPRIGRCAVSVHGVFIELVGWTSLDVHDRLVAHVLVEASSCCGHRCLRRTGAQYRLCLVDAGL